MSKWRITKRQAKLAENILWTIAIGFAFWADWRAGIALLAFDGMRAFEDIVETIEQIERVTKAGNTSHD